MFPLDIQMVDLKTQYSRIKHEIDQAIMSVINSAQFINGDEVRAFAQNLSTYLDNAFVIPCANGTDALQIALMSLDLEKGDEIIVPAFTYVATAEVIGLLGLKPVLVDVDPFTFNTSSALIEEHISPKTRAIVPVHLFGQSSDMEDILALAKKFNLFVIEDNAQTIGAKYMFSNGDSDFTGCIGDIGTTSFFPSKNLGCYGDGGALTTRDEGFAHKLQMIANHGQSKKYHHQIIGCNSRLDTIQAAVLNVKLKYLNQYQLTRYNAAKYYTENLNDLDFIITPFEASNSTHVYHQYTLRVKSELRDKLKIYLASHGIPTMIYYPLPLYEQVAFKTIINTNIDLPISRKLCKEVLSLPIHSEIDKHTQDFIIEKIRMFPNE